MSVDVERLRPAELADYAADYASTLARTGDALSIGGYLGDSDAFDRAVVRFAAAYADQNARDYERFRRETSLPARGS